MSTATYLVGDVFDRLAEIPDGSVDLVMTSPPFLALRSYLPAGHPDKGKEIGQEPTPAAFIDTLLALTAEWRRVLAPHGSIAVELGDTYAGGSAEGSDTRNPDSDRYRGPADGVLSPKNGKAWPLAKSMVGIPHLYHLSLAYGRNLLREPFTATEAFEWVDRLRASGMSAEAALAAVGGWVAEHGPVHRFEPWRVRNVVAWVRPNPPVGALGDKFRPATSYVTIACTSQRRYFDLDAVRTPHTEPGAVKKHSTHAANERQGWGSNNAEIVQNPAGAPPLDWWEIPTQPYSGSHYACVDDRTEALTLDGWKRHDDLVDGDLIAAYDQITGTIRWEPATFHRYPFDGDLVAIDKRETSQRLTPNHRVLVRASSGGQRVVRADELKPSHRLPVAAPFEDTKAADDPGASLAALLGWFVTEGGGKYRQAHIYQSGSANPDHCDTIRRLLEAVQADYTERSRVRWSSLTGREQTEVHWVINGSTARWLMDTAPAKSLPAAVLGWSERSCRALFDALIGGDGHTRADGRRQFIQKDPDTIDMVQALASRLGLRSTISPRRDGGYSLTIGERTWLSLRGTNGASEPIGTERYVGTVWCPSVPSTFWLARRNGRPFITGNTFPEALVVRPIEAMCPQRVCTVCGEPSRRITQVEQSVVTRGHYSNRNRDGERTTPKDQSGSVSGRRQSDADVAQRPGNHQGFVRTARTLGWTDCGCSDDGSHWRPGLVLDPFAGSGTTLAVATARGRDAIGIDLDERNLDLARERIGMWLQEDVA